MTPPLRLGVIGTGLIWQRTHQAILAELPHKFAPVAFCDVSPERRIAAARAFPGVPVLGDYHELLALPEVEAALILTPIALNAPVARAALLAGKHVIVEKPIARSMAEGQGLVDLARHTGRRLFVAEQMAYCRAESALAEIIAAGEIGDLVLWDVVLHLEADTAEGALRYDSTPWRKQADFPLGTMFDGGIHLIASLSTVFGAPETVAATGRWLRPEYGEYDHVAAMFQYPHGVAGLLSYSSYLPPSQNHFHVHGTAGVVVVANERIVVELPGRPARVVDLPDENPYVAMWHALHQAFVSQAAPRYTAEQAVSDVATLEAIDRAIKTRGRVPVFTP